MKTCATSKKEIKEVKDKLEAGVMFENEAAHYFAFVRKDGERVFFHNGKYRFFRNYDAFARAIVRIIKRGY